MKSLVVDDDFVTLTKLTTFLGQFGECHGATHAKQALQMYFEAFAKGEPYELLTLDIDLPGMSGLELLDLINEKEGVKQIPRARKLVISSNSSRGNVSQALQRHCDAFLVKPVSNDALTAALQKIGTTPQPAAK